MREFFPTCGGSILGLGNFAFPHLWSSLTWLGSAVCWFPGSLRCPERCCSEGRLAKQGLTELDATVELKEEKDKILGNNKPQSQKIPNNPISDSHNNSNDSHDNSSQNNDDFILA